MHRNFYLFLYDLLWITGFILVMGLSFIPIALLTSLIVGKFSTLTIIFSIPLLFYIFLNLYILICGSLFRLTVPRLKEGSYRTNSRQFIIWRVNWHFYSYVFLFFRRYLFYNRTIRFLFLRLMRVNLRYSTYMAEMIDLQDANNLITIGSNSGLGSEALLATHLNMGNDVMIFRRVTIGDNVMVSARACIAPGATIGHNVFIGFNTMLSLNVSIGEDTRIGANAVIGSNVKIGSNCRIGPHSVIKDNAVIPDGTVVPDFGRVTDTDTATEEHQAATS